MMTMPTPCLGTRCGTGGPNLENASDGSILRIADAVHNGVMLSGTHTKSALLKSGTRLQPVADSGGQRFGLVLYVEHILQLGLGHGVL